MTPRAQTPKDGVAWVTGGGSGIGKAVVLELVRRGWKVAITARNADALAELAQDTPGCIFAFPGDVTDADAMLACVKAIEQQHGPIALAFLNAGTSIYVSAPHLDLAAIRHIHNVNVMGMFNGLGALMPRMAERQSGQIAVCGSIAGYGGLPRAAAYSSSKAAVINAATALRFDCERLGILLQLVNPGFVDTLLTRTNDFPMPFLLPPDVAARACVDGFEKRGFEITFPRRFAFILKAVNLLPYPLYFWLVGLATGTRAKS